MTLLVSMVFEKYVFIKRKTKNIFDTIDRLMFVAD